MSIVTYQESHYVGVLDMYDQTGYVSGRYIGEAARSILDIIDYTKTYDIPVLLQHFL